MSSQHEEDVLELSKAIYEDSEVVARVKARFSNASIEDVLKWKQILIIRADVKKHMAVEDFPSYVKSLFNVISIEGSLKLARPEDRPFVGRGLLLLSEPDQKRLLINYRFTLPYRAFSDSSEYAPARHLMFKDATADVNFLRLQGYQNKQSLQYCLPENYGCPCGAWLDKNRDKWPPFLERLGGHLHNMRSAIAHEAQPVFITSFSHVYHGEKMPVELTDAFPNNKDYPDQYVTYSCKLDHSELDRMVNDIVLKLMLQPKRTDN